MNAIRRAVVAGRFYPADEAGCLEMLRAMRREVRVEGDPIAAVVPHAGWVFSGPTAALAYQVVARKQPETVVIFGAVHTLDRNAASLYPAGRWETPLGPVEVDAELASAVAEVPGVAVAPEAHAQEHSIEVQMPMIRFFLEGAKVLPLSVLPAEMAGEIGAGVARCVSELCRNAVFVASTDLTHYGPSFGFEPAGRGEVGIRWAKEVNDRRLIGLIAEMNATAVVAEAAVNHNACGAGAVAAVIGAAREAGAKRYVELEHTTSAERETDRFSSANSVGYEAGVFVR